MSAKEFRESKAGNRSVAIRTCHCVAQVVFLCCAALVPAGGCGKRHPPVAPRKAGIYRLSLTDNPDTLDPARFTGVNAEGVARRIFNGLVTFDTRLQPVPDLARSWRVSDDALTYTFHLREGVRFHSGRVLTADDVRYSFERLLWRRTASPRAWVVSAIAGAQAVREGKTDRLSGLDTPDKHTVVITLAKPFAPFLSHLAMGNAFIVPKEETTATGGPFGRRPVGTGPFWFERWDDNSAIHLTRNDAYFRGPAHLQGINFRIIKEPLVAYQEYLAGNLDHCAVPEGYLEEISRGPHANEMRTVATLSTYYLGIMMSHNPCGRNVHLRRALNYAVDRKRLCAKILGGSHAPAKGLVPPGLPAYNTDLEGYAYDPVRAREELKKAGYGPNNPAPVLTLYLRASRPTPRVAQAIQAQLKRAGVRVRLRMLDFAALREAINNQEPDLFYLGWIADFPDADNFLMLFHSRLIGGAGNRARYTDSEVDRLLDRAREEPDRERRLTLYRTSERKIVADAPWVFLSHKQTQLLVKPHVRNFALTPMDVGTSVNLVDFHRVSFAPE